jgi:hypothetical protein
MPMLADMVFHSAPAPSGAPPWLSYAADDLKAHRGHAFVHVGPHQPAELHALAHAMNEALGGRGHTFDVIEPVEAEPVDQAASFHELLQDMQAGQVRSLVILDANPAYTASSVGFADALRRVLFSLTTAMGPKETAAERRARLRRHHYNPAASGIAVVRRDQPAPSACPDARLCADIRDAGPGNAAQRGSRMTMVGSMPYRSS